MCNVVFVLFASGTRLPELSGVSYIHVPKVLMTSPLSVLLHVKEAPSFYADSSVSRLQEIGCIHM